MDAAHFVHEGYIGYVWSSERVFIPTPSGRNRWNILGAVNALTKEIVTVENEKYINSESVCIMLSKLANRKCGIPITVVLDNVPYQRCKIVENFAGVFGIELLFLPSYSPNLNLIERLWKFVKSKYLYCRYYDTFDKFVDAIKTCMHDDFDKNIEELESLLSLKFQSFKKVKILTD